MFDYFFAKMTYIYFRSQLKHKWNLIQLESIYETYFDRA